MAQTKVDLMAYGIDSVSAEKILKKYTIQQLKKQTMETLLSLGLSKEVAERLLHSTRPPYPSKNSRRSTAQIGLYMLYLPSV